MGAVVTHVSILCWPEDNKEFPLLIKDKAMINAICISGVKDFHIDEWPTMFLAIPGVGDAVRKNRSMVKLYVIEVMHEICGGKPRIVLTLDNAKL